MHGPHLSWPMSLSSSGRVRILYRRTSRWGSGSLESAGNPHTYAAATGTLIQGGRWQTHCPLPSDLGWASPIR